MSRRKNRSEDFSELHFADEEPEQKRKVRARKKARPARAKKAAPVSRVYDYDDVLESDFEFLHDDGFDLKNDPWPASFNPPYRRYTD